MQYHNKEKSFKVKGSTRAITRALAVPIAGAAFISPTFAQSTDLEEIVVTATRRATTVQDVPINISA